MSSSKIKSTDGSNVREASIRNFKGNFHGELFRMKIFALEHQPIRAAIQFRRYKKLLWEELGIEVSKETTCLAEEIQSHRFEPSDE